MKMSESIDIPKEMIRRLVSVPLPRFFKIINLGKLQIVIKLW